MSKLKKDTPKFIEEANAIHMDRYDYSFSVYRGSKVPLEIICRLHGVFKQRPNDHLQGKGCPVCGALSSIENRKYSTKDFIDKCMERHPNKFTYEKCNFINSETKVIVSCKEHGDFSKSPKSLLRGSGCPKCGAKAISNSKFLTKEEYIKRCAKRHNPEDFDYSKLVYASMSEPVEIICKEHGSFIVKANDFLHWGTCPSCSSGFKLNKRGYLYIISYFTEKGDVILKYGISNNVYNRINLSLKKNQNIVDAVILETFEFEVGEHAKELEKSIKRDLLLEPSADKESMPDGWTETFHPSEYRKVIKHILRKLNGKYISDQDSI